MADRPTSSTSRAGRPRIRSRSVHLPTCIPIASKAAKPRAKSVHKAPLKGKRKGDSKKKLGKTAIVISSDSEESLGEVDFPHFSPNQPLDIPAEGPEEPDQPNNPNPLPENPLIPMKNII